MNIVNLFYQRKWLNTYNYNMQDKILNRITELSSKINELLSRREELIKELHSMDKDISILYSTIHELKNLIEPETLNIDQSQEE